MKENNKFTSPCCHVPTRFIDPLRGGCKYIYDYKLRAEYAQLNKKWAVCSKISGGCGKRVTPILKVKYPRYEPCRQYAKPGLGECVCRVKLRKYQP